MVIGPIAVVYNVEGVDSLQLKPATLAKIFAGKITKWNDPAIAADNAGAKLPDDHDPVGAPLRRVGHHRQLHQVPDQDRRGRLDASATPRRGRPRAAPAPRARTAWPAAVKSTAGTIAYVELSFAENSDLKMAKIENGAGEFAELTGESAGKTIEGAKVAGTGNDLKLDIDYATKDAGCVPDRPGHLRDRLQQGQRRRPPPSRAS